MATFPVPPDARAGRDFEIIKGTDEMLRTGFDIADATKSVKVGEWGKIDANGKFAKIVVADDITSPALGARVSWTKFVPGDSNLGQADVLATKTIDSLSGSYQAKTKLFDPAGVYTAGVLLVAVYDAIGAGWLVPLDPANTSARQLSAVVGKCIKVASGVLWYEAV